MSISFTVLGHCVHGNYNYKFRFDKVIIEFNNEFSLVVVVNSGARGDIHHGRSGTYDAKGDTSTLTSIPDMETYFRVQQRNLFMCQFLYQSAVLHLGTVHTVIIILN